MPSSRTSSTAVYATLAILGSLAVGMMPLASATASAAKPANLAAGKATFQANCMICHGTTGRGDGLAAAGLNPKPANFTDAARMSASNEARQFKTIRGGGASTGLSAAMPAFEETLSDDQIRDVLAYVRTTLMTGTSAGMHATN